MTEAEWLACDEPDILLDEVEDKVPRSLLVEFVRHCWEHITPRLPPLPHTVTVVEEFAGIANKLNDHDAAIYADEAAIKASLYAPDMRVERRHQAMIFRQLVGRI